MYKVIKFFTDLQDNNYAYDVGDEFPRKGVIVMPSRYEELASDKNRQGQPLIKEFNEPKDEPKKDVKPRSKKADSDKN